MTPFVFFSRETMAAFGIPTITGQYILKNVVFIAVGFVMIGTFRSSQEPS